MATRDEAAAYDLSLFENKKARLVALKPNKKEQKSNSRHQRMQSVLNATAYVLIAIVALGIVGFLITSNLQLTEMNSQIAESRARLSELQSEQVRLESELASKTSIANVNTYALENGMSVANGNQIHYITLSGSDTVTVANGETGWFQQIWQSVSGIFA